MDKKEKTKERLIQASITAFAEYGFEGTTTRMIAKKADCNLAAIPYYFGSKEGLYHSVFERITDLPASHLRPHIDEITSFLGNSEREPEKALILLEKLLGNMVDLFCGHPKVAQYAQLIVREQLSPSSAYDIPYNKIITRVVGAISKLIKVITAEEDERKSAYQAFMLIGQILIFRNGREAIVRRLGLEGYNADEIDEIRQLITAWTGKALKPD